MVVENNQNRIIETDVLVIGGGIGGPTAALFASEGGARVVLLEKADVRRSGAAGVGVTMWHQLLVPGLTLNGVAKDITTSDRREWTFTGTISIVPITRRLIDENLVYIGYRDNWEVVHALERWGINMKWDDGQYKIGPRIPDAISIHARNIKRDIARILKDSPVTVLERTMGLDLLMKDGVIAGATALDVRTGEFTVIKAKAVILATGTISRIFNPYQQTAPGRFRMLYEFHAGSGDGAAMAFRAGAELVNFEVPGVGQYFTGTLTEKIPLYFVSQPSRIYDSRGEQLEWDCPQGLSVKTQYRLEREGRGPCFYDTAKFPDEWHEGMLAEEWYEGLKEYRTVDCQPITAKWSKERGLDTKKDKFEILHWKPEHNAIFSGVLYDENGQTTVGKLYAVGDMTGGSTFTGMAQAAVFGMRAGKHIVANMAKMDQMAIDEKQVARQKEMVSAPKNVKWGVEPLEVEIKIRDIVERYCGPERSEGSINQGLWRLRQVRHKFLPLLQARDNHELMSAQEIRNLFLLADAYMVCARERKESGLGFFRLDYPEKIDVPWEKAIIARLENNEIKVSCRKMPKLRPEYGGK